MKNIPFIFLAILLYSCITQPSNYIIELKDSNSNDSLVILNNTSNFSNDSINIYYPKQFIFKNTNNKEILLTSMSYNNFLNNYYLYNINDNDKLNFGSSLIIEYQLYIKSKKKLAITMYMLYRVPSSLIPMVYLDAYKNNTTKITQIPQEKVSIELVQYLENQYQNEVMGISLSEKGNFNNTFGYDYCVKNKKLIYRSNYYSYNHMDDIMQNTCDEEEDIEQEKTKMLKKVNELKKQRENN